MNLVKKTASVVSVALLLLSSFFMDAQVVSACSCIEPGSPYDALAEAQAVFVGTVTEIDKTEGQIISSADPVKVTFAVSQFWKGPVEDTVVITTSRFSDSCGFEFQDEVTYLVYAYGEGDDLVTGLCTRTTPLVSAGSDLAALGTGVLITEQGADRAQLPIIEGIILIALFAGLFLYRRQSF